MVSFTLYIHVCADKLLKMNQSALSTYELVTVVSKRYLCLKFPREIILFTNLAVLVGGGVSDYSYFQSEIGNWNHAKQIQ